MNITEVPEKTEERCEGFARFVANVLRLTAPGERAQAVACFAMLYALLKAVGGGGRYLLR